MTMTTIMTPTKIMENNLNKDNQATPKITKEQRIKLRRERIRNRQEQTPATTTNLKDKLSSNAVSAQTKRDNDNDDNINNNNINSEIETLSKSEQQISIALSHLTTFKNNGLETLSQIRIHANQQENIRRKARHESKERIRIDCIERNKMETETHLKDIEAAWDVLTNIKNLQDLHNGIMDIKCSYQNLFERNDSMLSELQSHLKDSDVEYLNSLKQHEAITESLRDKTEEHFKTMQTMYHTEMLAIEDSYREEKSEIIHTKNQILNSHLIRKQRLEQKHLIALENRRKCCHEDINASKDQVSKDYNTLKSKLLTELRNLECDFEASRAMYQLNADKLEYDYRVLKNHNSDMEQTIKKKKKRAFMIKDELNKTLEQTIQREQYNAKKGLVLEQDCRRMEGQFQNLVTKYKRFEVLNDQKYFSILALHQEDIDSYLERIACMEKRIYDDILSLPLLEENHNNQPDFVKWTTYETDSMTDGVITSSCEASQGYENDKQLLLWSHIENALIKYHEILEERETKQKNIQKMKNQNEQLFAKVKTLFQDDRNRYFLYPPLDENDIAEVK